MAITQSKDCDLVFYTNPMSRGRIVRWMLEEVGAEYRQVLLAYDTDMKAQDYLALNPMGKVPALVHRGPGGHRKRRHLRLSGRCLSRRWPGAAAGGSGGLLPLVVFCRRAAGGGGDGPGAAGVCG